MLHGAPADEAYKQLAERYEFKRETSRILFGRAVSLDVPTLLAYLYRRFALQVLLPVGNADAARTAGGVLPVLVLLLLL